MAITLVVMMWEAQRLEWSRRGQPNVSVDNRIPITGFTSNLTPMCRPALVLQTHIRPFEVQLST